MEIEKKNPFLNPAAARCDTPVLFVASQASKVCFQIEKSDDFHGCSIILLTNLMLMSTTVHCTNTPSRV